MFSILIRSHVGLPLSCISVSNYFILCLFIVTGPLSPTFFQVGTSPRTPTTPYQLVSPTQPASTGNWSCGNGVALQLLYLWMFPAVKMIPISWLKNLLPFSLLLWHCLLVFSVSNLFNSTASNDFPAGTFELLSSYLSSASTEIGLANSPSIWWCCCFSQTTAKPTANLITRGSLRSREFSSRSTSSRWWTSKAVC